MKKGFILGLVTGVVLTGASLVFANSQIQVIKNDQIKISLNGKIQTFKDETTGETQFPITYHDRTYLPLRNVAQLAGLDVDYNSNNNEAMLRQPLYLSRINTSNSGIREATFFKDYLCILYTAPWGQVPSELHLIDDSGKERVFGVYYDEENEKFMYKIENDKIVVTEYVRDGIDESYGGMSKFFRRDYEIVLENGVLVEKTIKEDHNDIKHDAST